jgi:hypothetical protein
MIVPFVGPSYEMEALSFDAQRTVNMYPLISESGTSKSVAALRSCSGIQSKYTFNSGPIRGGIESQGRAFFVSGDEFYEVFTDNTTTLRGTLDTATSYVFIEESPTQLMLLDNEFGYIFNKTTNTLTKITDTDFPSPANSLTFQDGYFIVSSDTYFAISALNNGLSWDAADRQTVESNPDNIVSVFSDSSNLWLFGTKNTEVFYNSGAAAFPFVRVSGAIVETGCAAAATVREIDNRLIWLGTDENGDAIVWGSNGYNAQRLSTQAIERMIATSTDFNESVAWVYHERGHAFYCLNVQGLNSTLVFDLSTQQWHERVYRNPSTGAEEQHRAQIHVFFEQMHLVGDRELAKVYELRLDTYSDDGDPMIRERTSPHYHQEKMLVSHSQFELDTEVGQGTDSGQGEDPLIAMKYSDDGGYTWSAWLYVPLGPIGSYRTRVKWNKLGRSRDRVYKVRVTDPVFVQFNEALINGV